MALDYFYGSQADQFAFYRIPKALFRGVYKGVSIEAKLLYGLMLDRMELSAKNGWLDSAGRVYIVYSIEEIMDAMGCGTQKVAKLLDVLEKDCGLIERRRLGMGRPNIIYVKNFIDNSSESNISRASEIEIQDFPKSKIKNFENQNSGVSQIEIQDFPKSKSNDTYINETDINNTEFSPPYNPPAGSEGASEQPKGALSREERERLKQQLEDKLRPEQLKAERPDMAQDIDQFFEIARRAVCSGKTYQQISGEQIPTESVKSVLLGIDKELFGTVLTAWAETAAKVKNPRQYMLTMLYNAPLSGKREPPRQQSVKQIDMDRLRNLVNQI